MESPSEAKPSHSAMEDLINAYPIDSDRHQSSSTSQHFSSTNVARPSRSPVESKNKSKMTGGKKRSAEDINSILIKLLPECDSEYARYPMKYSKWLGLGEKDPMGKPAWIKRSWNQGVIKDYVYGRGPGGPAYYHLLTKIAYTNLYTRICNECPVACCSLNKQTRKSYDEWQRAKRIIHARYSSSKPNDQVAANQQIQGSKATAQFHYNAGQTEQILVNFAN